MKYPSEPSRQVTLKASELWWLYTCYDALTSFPSDILDMIPRVKRRWDEDGNEVEQEHPIWGAVETVRTLLASPEEELEQTS